LSLVISIKFFGASEDDFVNTMLGASSFIFGVFFSYYLSVSSNKFSKINEALRKDDKNMLSVFYAAEELKQEDRKKIVKLIDEYLVSQIDYYLKDYSKTSENFLRLFRYCKSIDPKGFKEERACGQISKCLDDSLGNRKIVESQLACRISSVEWFILILFAGILMTCMFILSNGALQTSLLMATVSMGIFTILYLLNDIDSLKWKSSQLIWTPLTKLFKDMNLLPYFPKTVLKNINIPFKKEKVRVVKYLNEYPDFKGKVVEEVEIN
jgi:ABC-type multidrug transport system fused ATPase/permease subunit